MNGLEFLAKINEEVSNHDKNLQILVLTSSDNNNDLEECFRLNVGGYLKKPLESSKLKDIIENVSKLQPL